MYSGAVGLFLALVVVKLGNPVIMDDMIVTPRSREELALGPWPVVFGYAMLLLVVALGLRFWRWQTAAPRWWLGSLVLWIGWQFVSAGGTVDGKLTRTTVPHFVACGLLFSLGLFSFSRVSRKQPFWVGLVGGVLVVLLVGWRQHFGGLEETRRFVYSLPEWQSLPPDLLRKVESNRIYSTLFYPNALAGLVLLLVPIVIGIAWPPFATKSRSIRFSGVFVISVLGLGCLYWSGSKAGWLIALVQIAIAISWQPISPTIKRNLIIVLVVGALGGFSLKYATYFERGATSVVARFDYWRAAVLTIKESPIFGSGPGTFMIRYRHHKPAEAEMARLAHNDFLQQASDSGLMGGLAYGVWSFGGLAILYRNHSGRPLASAIWIGLFGVTVQGLVEFGLYIPAISWVSFFLMGWLGGGTNQIDKPKQRS